MTDYGMHPVWVEFSTYKDIATLCFMGERVIQSINGEAFLNKKGFEMFKEEGLAQFIEVFLKITESSLKREKPYCEATFNNKRHEFLKNGINKNTQYKEIFQERLEGLKNLMWDVYNF